MRRLKLVAGILIAVLAAFMVAIYVALSQLDLDAYRAEIQRRVQAATGRELVIDGPIDLDIGLMPAVTVERVRFANAAWGSSADMATVERFELELALWPLISGELRVNRLVLVAPTILLETGPDGRGNWRLDGEEARSGGTDDGTGMLPAFQRIRVEDGRLTYRGAAGGAGIELALDRVIARAQTDRNSLRVEARGGYQGVPFTLAGEIGPPRALLSRAGRYPLDLTLEAADASLKVAGEITGLADAAKADLRVEAKAADLARLGALSGTSWPTLGPLRVETRVLADAGSYTLEGLAAELGGSDLSGSATLEVGGGLPRVSARLRSAVLDLADLRPQRPGETEIGDNGAAAQPGDSRLFADTPLPFEVLRTLDGEADLKVGTLRLGGGASMSAVAADLTLRDGRLALQPLSGHLGAGALDMAGALDAGASPPRFDLRLAAQDIDYGRLLADLDVTEGVAGKAGAQAHLRGAGNSPRALAASLSGQVQVVGEGGRVSDPLLNAAAADVARVLAPWRETGEAMTINCVVARFDVRAGVMESRVLLADTNAATLLGDGSISLKDERFDLRLTPQAKRPNLVSLAVPMRLTGPLTDPALAPDALGAAKAGAIAVGSLVNPLATLGALLAESASASGNPCVAALEKAERLQEAENDDPESEAGSGDPAGDSLSGFLEGLSRSIDKQLGVESNGQQDDPALLQDRDDAPGN